MNKPAKFWNRIASRYAKQPIADERSYQEKLHITQKYLKPYMTVLELGCGTGSTSIAHAPFVKDVLAIDISSEMIKIAQNKALANNIENIKFNVQSIDTFIDQHGTDRQNFDIVMTHSLLHLVENETKVINDIHKILKHDGLLISSTLCLGDSLLAKILSPVISIAAYFSLLPKLTIFTSKQLLKNIQRAGFHIEHQWHPKKNSAMFIIARKVIS